MSTTNEEVVRRYYEQVIKERKVDLVPELFADDVTFNDPQSPSVRDSNELAATISAYLEGMDGYFQIEDILSAGDKVAVRATGSGRHAGELFGIPPTGKSFKADTMSIYRVEGGKITEIWHLWDTLGLLRQLGIDPQQWQPGTAPSQ